MRALEHPMKAELEAVRAIILAADPSIAEGIKWNAPSFRVTDYFATANLRARGVVQLIMHFGAKINEVSAQGIAIDDPARLLQWLAKDRATIRFRDLNAIRTNADALTAIVRQWIVHVR